MDPDFSRFRPKLHFRFLLFFVPIFPILLDIIALSYPLFFLSDAFLRRPSSILDLLDPFF